MRLFKTFLILLYCIPVFSQTFSERVTCSLGISINFPGKPSYSKTHDPNIGTYSYLYNYTYNGSDFVFQVNQLIYPTSERDLVEGKDIVVNSFVQGVDGRLLNSRLIKMHNRNCIEFSYRTFRPFQRIHRSHAYVFKDHLIIVTYSSEVFQDEFFNRFANTIVFP